MKYSSALKAEIAAKYMPYVYTRNMLADEYGIPERTIRDWTANGRGRYNQSLIDAVRAKYNPRVYSIGMLARYFNIPRSTIGFWVK